MDAGAGRGRGDAAPAGAGLGRPADRGRVQVQSRDGSSLSRGRGLDGLPDAAACEGPGWAGGVARRPVSAAPRQRRRRPPGSGAREGHRGQLRTVERTVAPLRQAIEAEARATIRFETPAGRQLQIDFGETRVAIGGENVRVHLFVATPGYSRRCFVRAFRHERQSAWFDGIEAAFRHFGGVPEEVLLDNARALVEHHDAATREVRFNARLHAFARYWAFRARACAPYRARTKGKDERGVGYAKRNAIAGHRFASWAALEAHLAWWMREIADPRVHGTTGEPPLERFRRDEATALRRSAAGRHSGRSASWCAGSRPTAASSSTPTATACRGG